MGFLDEKYLLENEEACDLYGEVRNFPVLDAHNHGDVKEIVDNEGWDNIWEVEGATDHYVWELMRRCGVEEEKITGKASDREKWQALAQVFPRLAGNPTYEWIHLDLKRRFDIQEEISGETAKVIWEKSSALLGEEKMKPQNLLREMNVEIMCTTDDPASGLGYHKRAREEVSGVQILPTWRPDRGMNIEQDTWKDFLLELEETFSVSIKNLDDYLQVLKKSHDFFDEMGCVASDHGITRPAVYPVGKKKAARIFEKRVNAEKLTATEVRDFKAFMMVYFGELNEQSGWVTQLHIGAVRDYRDKLFCELGKDSGGDISTNDLELAENMKPFFNRFDGEMPIVLYFLDPVLEPTMTVIARAFPNVFLGAPWWFNDSPYGIARHLEYIGSVDLLSNHAGMVTDSRKLMSYDSRTEVFRRTACNVLGKMVNRGQMSREIAVSLLKDISYETPRKIYFS